MIYDLVGSTALVTGAARGIGQACAELLSSCGARVYAADIEPVAESERVMPISLDVADTTKVRQFVASCDDPIQVIVNNAAVYTPREGLSITIEEWRRSFQVIVEASLVGTAAVADRLRSSRLAGAVVNVASIAGFLGNVNQVDYCAAKAALIGLTRAAALDLIRDDITVNAVCPGSVDTPMIHRVAERIARAEDIPKEAALARIVEDIPTKRFQQPSEIAQAVAFLASTGARSITGQLLVVDGGQSVAI